jgi:NAD(P)H-dependent FMN reductase
MTHCRPLSIPVILGTTRKGRMSAHAARFMVQQIEMRQKMTTADALLIVTPEYNHSFPGLLKHVLDSCLKEYIHKAAGIVGVSLDLSAACARFRISCR